MSIIPLEQSTRMEGKGIWPSMGGQKPEGGAERGDDAGYRE